MQQFRTEAIILRRTNYGEADRIINVLTPERGKISAIAKGVRRPKSKLAGGLELFAVCDVTILQGKSDIGVITSARLKHFYGDILHDYDRLQSAYGVIKRINKTTETVFEQEFYHLLHDALLYLGDLTIDWRLTELWFTLQLATLLGGGINLLTDKEDQPLVEDGRYGFDAVAGAFCCSRQGNFGGKHIKLLRLASKNTPPLLARISGVTMADVGEALAIARSTESL